MALNLLMRILDKENGGQMQASTSGFECAENHNLARSEYHYEARHYISAASWDALLDDQKVYYAVGTVVRVRWHMQGEDVLFISSLIARVLKPHLLVTSFSHSSH